LLCTDHGYCPQSLLDSDDELDLAGSPADDDDAESSPAEVAPESAAETAPESAPESAPKSAPESGPECTPEEESIDTQTSQADLAAAKLFDGEQADL
jgi:hypothetical protein